MAPCKRYHLNYFVGIFFNGALMACANIRLSGGRPSIGAGFRIALSRVGSIAAWAFVAATVGLVLGSLGDRNSKLLSGVYGSIHRSEEMIRSHWGEQVAGSFGFGLLTTVLSIPAVLLALALWRTDFMAGTAPAGSRRA